MTRTIHGVFHTSSPVQLFVSTEWTNRVSSLRMGVEHLSSGTGYWPNSIERLTYALLSTFESIAVVCILSNIVWMPFSPDVDQRLMSWFRRRLELWEVCIWFCFRISLIEHNHISWARPILKKAGREKQLTGVLSQFGFACLISFSVGAQLKSPPHITGFCASSSRRYFSKATFHSFLYSMFWSVSSSIGT